MASRPVVAPAVPIHLPVYAARRDAASDLDYMERVRLGDETALGLLLERYWTVLVRYSIGFLGDIDTAEDIVQEGFVRVWR